MKQIFTLILTLLTLFPSSIEVFAELKGKCGENLEWQLDRGGLLIITGEGRMNDYSKSTLPWRAELVHDVKLPEGMTYLGNNAFNGSKIIGAYLPSTLKEIGKSAFANCGKMKTAVLPYGLVKIGDNAFRGCKSLVTMQIPSSVRSIGESAFADCKKITGIGIPLNVEEVGLDVFKGCEALTSLTSLPELITFENCRQYGLSPTLVSTYDRTASLAALDVAVNIDNKPVHRPSIKADIEYGESDIDRHIPETAMACNRTFAFIFANENYSSLPDVSFAINDGKSFASYCHTTLGIPERNVNVYYDATYGNMRAAIEYMKKVDEAFRGDVSFIVYYAGHGAPDEKTSNAYLIPTDAYGINESVCYPLETLYSELGSLKAKSVKVFMDACFSGVDRGNDMLAEGGRIVATVPKKASVTGNVVVVSATSNDQAAWHYAAQGHGLFTYCLIKKLQETQGDVSMGELCDYLEEQVPMISIVQNRVTQTPTSQSSARLGTSWRLWQLKQ